MCQNISLLDEPSRTLCKGLEKDAHEPLPPRSNGAGVISDSGTSLPAVAAALIAILSKSFLPVLEARNRFDKLSMGSSTSLVRDGQYIAPQIQCGLISGCHGCLLPRLRRCREDQLRTAPRIELRKHKLLRKS